MNYHNSKANVEIYTFCKKERMDFLRRDEERYGLGRKFITASSYAEFLEEAIEKSQGEYILLTADNVLLPFNIKEILDDLVSLMNSENGEDGWLMAGNAGVEYFSNKRVEYRNEKELMAIPAASGKPRHAVFLDSNTVLLNLKNLKNKKIGIDNNILGSNYLLLYLLAQGYKSGLVSCIDSRLFDYNQYPETAGEEDLEDVDEGFGNYWRNNFINHKIFIPEGEVYIENDFRYLEKNSNDKRLDFYDLVGRTIVEKQKETKGGKNIYIITRTRLDKINRLERLLETVRIGKLLNNEIINLKLVLSVSNPKEGGKNLLNEILNEYDDVIDEIVHENDSEEKKQYPRVSAIQNAIEKISGEDGFVWFVDDDDFIMPENLKYLYLFLDQEKISIFDSVKFEEKWENEKNVPLESKKCGYFDGSSYFEAIKGINNVPICNVVYPLRILRRVFSEHELMGDYFEDYAMFLLSLKHAFSIRHYPVNIAGISYHGKNTVLEKDRTHWNYSHATFMNEVVNSGFMKEIFYENIVCLKKNEIAGGNRDPYIRKGLLKDLKNHELLAKANAIRKRKGFLSMVRYFILYARHGRSYFRDGVERLEKNRDKK